MLLLSKGTISNHLCLLPDNPHSPPGTLQQAVLTECIASEVVAIPLLCMTRAHATCDWALVLSLSIFGVSSCAAQPQPPGCARQPPGSMVRCTQWCVDTSRV